MRTALVFVLGAAACVACAALNPTLPSSTTLSEESGVDSAVLDRGRATWTRECATCHRTYWPHEYAPDRWKSLGPDMGDRAGLGPEEIGELTEFLVTASRHARREAGTR